MYWVNKLSSVLDVLRLDNILTFEAELDFLLEHEIETTESLEALVCHLFNKSSTFTRSKVVQTKCNRLFVKYNQLVLKHSLNSYMESIVSSTDSRGCLSLRASQIEALSVVYRNTEQLSKLQLDALRSWSQLALSDPMFDGVADCIRMSVAVSLENLASVLNIHRSIAATANVIQLVCCSFDNKIISLLNQVYFLLSAVY